MSRREIDPERWLVLAGAMLSGAGALGSAAVSGGWWPKACACLIRLSLEQAVDAYWERVNPRVASPKLPWRTKLLMLRSRTGPGLTVARRITYAWNTLSRAMHHHCYDIQPTVTELRHLHTETTVLIRMLQQHVGGESSVRKVGSLESNLRPALSSE